MPALDEDAPGDVGDVVVLTRTLTSYHRSLKKGVQGTIVGGSSSGKDFASVKFPEITLPILWDSMRPTHADLPVQPAPEPKPPKSVPQSRIRPLSKPPKTTVKLFRPLAMAFAVTAAPAPKAPIALAILNRILN